MKNLFVVCFILFLVPFLAFAAPPAADGPYDSNSGAMMTVSYPHHEIHSGSHFFFTDSTELGSAATQSYLIETMIAASSSKEIHLVFKAEGSAITQFQLYEETDRSGLASAATLLHSHRQFTLVSSSTLTLYKGVASGTTDGTLIWQYKGGAAGGASRTPVSAGRNDEIILRTGTKYLFKVTSGTAANLTNVAFHWYEHTPKDL